MGADRPNRPWTALAIIVGLPLAWSLLAGYRFGQEDSIYTAWRGGAAIPALALDEVWRVITAPLLHVDLLHLVNNLVFLAVVVVMSGRVRSFPLLLVAALSAWTATAAGVLTRPGWALGASAGLYGLVGGIAASAMRDADRRRLAGQILVVAFVVIALGPGDRPAHLIGLVTGAVFAHLPSRGAISRGLHGVVLTVLLAGLGFGLMHADDPPQRWRPVTTGESTVQVPDHWVAAAAVGPCAEIYTDGLRAACGLSAAQTADLDERLTELGYHPAAPQADGRWTIRRWRRLVGTGTLLEGVRTSPGQTILLTVGSDGGRAPWLVPARFSP